MMPKFERLRKLRRLPEVTKVTFKDFVTFVTFLTFVTCVTFIAFAQEVDLEFTLDVVSSTIPLPKIFKPNIDISGRGFSRQGAWPQTIAAGEVLDMWQKDIGFNGLYRLQYNIWEAHQPAKEKGAQDNPLSNYENIIKRISDAGGIVILDIFGMPAGLGKVLDKRSAPIDLKVFKELVKDIIKDLSCTKKYNVWYEVWSAPDLDEFFLGRKQEYLNLYKAVAEAVKELKAETKIHIPLGGPSSSWWFQNLDGNTVVTPERSLIYELIRFCFRYQLPLDFISWHAYSTDPKAEKEITSYKKTAASLIRDWLFYFNMDSNIPLIVDEWNYDSGANVLPERYEKSNIAASYVPSRLKNMHEAGLDYQLYFSLEDFRSHKEGVVRNTGIFWFDSDSPGYSGGPKSIYNIFRMLASLGSDMFILPKFNDAFVGMLATKAEDYIALLLYNYIDPDAAINYISRNIANLNDKERKILLRMIRSGELEKLIRQKADTSKIRAGNKLKALLKKAQELDAQAAKFRDSPRTVKIAIKNLNPARNKSSEAGAPGVSSEAREDYSYQRYIIDSSCGIGCGFVPAQEKTVIASEPYEESLGLDPYSVNMIILKKKPKEPEVASSIADQGPSSDTPVP